MLYTTKNLRKIPTYFPTPHRTPWNPHRSLVEGTYIGHAELSYHGPCHAFHLLQVTTSTWHCLMHDSTLKLINFVFSVFLILVANIPWVSDATGHFCWDFWRPPSFWDTHLRFIAILGSCLRPEGPPKKTLTWHDTGRKNHGISKLDLKTGGLDIPEPCYTQSNPLYISFDNDSYGSTN